MRSIASKGTFKSKSGIRERRAVWHGIGDNLKHW